MFARRLAALWCLGTVGCGGGGVTVTVDADRAALSIFLGADVLMGSQWSIGPASVPIDPPAATDELFLFRFRRDRFAFNGGPWHEHAPTVLRAAMGDTCRRCYSPQGFIPQVALPGEVCPLPAMSEGALYDPDSGSEILESNTRVEAIRSSALFQWPGSDSTCLRVALIGRSQAADTFEEWFRARSTSVTRLHGLFPAQPKLSAELLADFDVIVLFAPDRGYSGDEAGVLRDWVAAGGGLVVMTGFNNTFNPINGLISRLGVEFHGERFDDSVLTFADHPAVRGIDVLPYTGGFLVRTSSRTVTAAVPIATVEAGVVAMAAEVEAGRVVLWGDDEIHLAGAFEGSPAVRTFWGNAITWVAGKL